MKHFDFNIDFYQRHGYTTYESHSNDFGRIVMMKNGRRYVCVVEYVENGKRFYATWLYDSERKAKTYGYGRFMRKCTRICSKELRG